VSDQDEADLVRAVIGVADSLFGLVESWERRRSDENVSDRSRRMLVADLGDVVKFLPKDTELFEFVAELSTLSEPLTYADGAEQVKWIAKRLCGAHGIDSRRLKPRKGIVPADMPDHKRVTAILPKPSNNNRDDSMFS
jgi:hypothetical protein